MIDDLYIMPYYGLFSHDLHILGLQWRSCAHYFYVLRFILTSQWVMHALAWDAHCDVARDIYCDITMGNAKL